MTSLSSSIFSLPATSVSNRSSATIQRFSDTSKTGMSGPSGENPLEGSNRRHPATVGQAETFPENSAAERKEELPPLSLPLLVKSDTWNAPMQEYEMPPPLPLRRRMPVFLTGTKPSGSSRRSAVITSAAAGITAPFPGLKPATGPSSSSF